jgi:hypothetical protein
MGYSNFRGNRVDSSRQGTTMAVVGIPPGVSPTGRPGNEDLGF